MTDQTYIDAVKAEIRSCLEIGHQASTVVSHVKRNTHGLTDQQIEDMVTEVEGE